MEDPNLNLADAGAPEPAPSAVRQPMTEDELHSCVSGEIDRAVQYIDEEISPLREAAVKYYDGEKFGDEEEGRSQVISLDVRDTVNALMPSLMRIFFGPECVAEFAPQGPEDIETAKQATDYVDYVIKRDNPGFLTLYAAFKDALVKKAGIVKYWFDESVTVERHELSGLDEEALALLMAEIETDPDVEIGLAPGPDGLAAGEIRRRHKQDRIRIAAVPPEEFLISPNARSIEDARFSGHRQLVTVSDLVALGYDYEFVVECAGASTHFDNVEAIQRNDTTQHQDYSTSDPTQRKVLYVEGYLRVDYDGDGIAELRRICTIGDAHKVARNEVAAVAPFALFCPDPEPHQFFGTSIADVTMDVQRVKSAILRNMLDSLAQSIHPRTGVVEGQVNIADALNSEVGGIIRMNAPGMVQPFAMPFTGKEAFPMLDYWDTIRENRTGITKAAAGLDPDALQSTTKAAVAATISAANQHVELIARVFAETGMRQLYRGILGLLAKHQQKARVIKLRNKWVPVNPAAWRADMDVIVNLGVGDGTIEERLAGLKQIVTQQEAILQTLGPQNPIVTLQQYRDTMCRAIEMAGFKDASSFFLPVDPNAQLPQAQAGAGDPAQLLAQVQVEQIKADIAMKQAELQLKREQMLRADDRERDRLDADIQLRAAEIQAKYGAQVNMAEIRAQVDRDRNVMYAGMQAQRAAAQQGAE